MNDFQYVVDKVASSPTCKFIMVVCVIGMGYMIWREDVNRDKRLEVDRQTLVTLKSIDAKMDILTTYKFGGFDDMLRRRAPIDDAGDLSKR